MNMNEGNIDEIDEIINIDSKISQIIDIYELISDIKNPRKRIAMKYKFNNELDKMIDLLENYYYKNVLKYRKTLRNTTLKQRDIYNTHKTIEVFLPYLLLHNLNQNINI